MSKLKEVKLLMDNLEVDKALLIIHSLIDEGIVEAYGMLAYIYEYDKRINPRLVQDAYNIYYKKLEENFNNGDINSGLILAGALRFPCSNHMPSKDNQLNEIKAVEIYEKCAKLGSSKALIILADIYSTGGLGIEKNINKSFSLLEHAAKMGSSEAMHELGILFLMHKKDEKTALFWIKKSAEAGYWQAKDYLDQIHKSNHR